MTTSTTDTVTISLHHSDAVRYVRVARRPAVPEVRELIKSAVDRDPFAARHDIVIPVETARTFVRKSTRPLRLWTGQTMKSLLQLALQEYEDQQSSTPSDQPGEPEEGVVAAAVEEFNQLPAEVEPGEESEAAADLLRDSEPEDQYEGALRGDGFVDAPVETELDVHSTEPDQEPSPVAEESDEDDN